MLTNNLIYKFMSLTLFFIVLSIGIGYMLYDTFKKSREYSARPSQSLNNKLKVNYTTDCSILNSLQKQKKSSIKTRTISVNLSPLSFCLEEPSEEDREIIKEIFMILNKSHRIYLLTKKQQEYGYIVQMIKSIIDEQYWIQYMTDEGAVAILRQLSSGIHLQGTQSVFNKIKQYLNNIWYVGEDSEQQAVRQFKTETQMIKFLSNMYNIKSEDK